MKLFIISDANDNCSLPRRTHRSEMIINSRKVDFNEEKESTGPKINFLDSIFLMTHILMMIVDY